MSERRQTEEHRWTAEERREHLETFAERCELLAAMAGAVMGAGGGQPYVERAAQARRLLAEGFTQDDLSELGAAFPELPGTFNPRALDMTGSVTDAELELAAERERVAESAQLLRSVGTLEA